MHAPQEPIDYSILLCLGSDGGILQDNGIGQSFMS